MSEVVLCADCGKTGTYFNIKDGRTWRFASPFIKGADGKYRHDMCQRALEANGRRI